MKIGMPLSGEYAPYYGTYIGKINTDDQVAALQQQETEVVKFLKELPAGKAGYRYAEGKWSIKELIVHLSDAERIFAYRALRFARNDKTDLAGFDEEKYTPESNADNRPMEDIIREFQTVRQATLTLFSSFTNEMVTRQGKANGQPVSPRALGAIILGHTLHHMQVIRERYLVS